MLVKIIGTLYGIFVGELVEESDGHLMIKDCLKIDKVFTPDGKILGNMTPLFAPIDMELKTLNFTDYEDLTIKAPKLIESYCKALNKVSSNIIVEDKKIII